MVILVKITSVEVSILLVNSLITIGLVLAIFSSIAAWLNTQIILKYLSEIKAKLEIKENKKPSFLDKDFSELICFFHGCGLLSSTTQGPYYSSSSKISLIFLSNEFNLFCLE